MGEIIGGSLKIAGLVSVLCIMEDVCVFENSKERAELFQYLSELPVEYHKEYKRFNKIVKVPRGQASYTLSADIHYDYKVSGGSPPNTVMCDTLKMITQRVNEKLGTNFNTILMNVYKDGDDVGWHSTSCVVLQRVSNRAAVVRILTL